MNKILIVILVFFYTNNILSQRLYDEDAVNKYNLNFSPSTKKYKKYIKQPQSFPDKLDSNAVYLLTYKDVGENDSSIIFIRFFSNNECFVSERYLSVPNVEEFKKMEYGRRSMYNYKQRKSKPDEVIIEHYNTFHFPKQFFYKFFRFEGNDLNYYKKNTESGFCFDATKISYLAKKVLLP